VDSLGSPDPMTSRWKFIQPMLNSGSHFPFVIYMKNLFRKFSKNIGNRNPTQEFPSEINIKNRKEMYLTIGFAFCMPMNGYVNGRKKQFHRYKQI